jgi:hypothetical protein
VCPRLRRSVCRGWTELPEYSLWLPDILLGSHVFFTLRWTTLGKVLRVGAVRRYLYLAAKPVHVGVDVDELACPLHRHMACGHQTRGHGLLSGIVLSRRFSEAVTLFWGM